MKNIAKFEKISLYQFKKDLHNLNYRLNVINYCDGYDFEAAYKNIKLPCRATIGSAGYDFFNPYDRINVNPNSSIFIPTGIKCRIQDGWWLGIFPKSSFGLKYKATLSDTISVIDGDYYNNITNEGHIFIELHNNSDQILTINKNQSYIQGIFLPYGLTEDDNVSRIRTGGFGSTS